VLFSLAAQLAGWRSEAIEHLASHAGLAQGIAQVVAALPRDASRRQLFIPLQLLQQNEVGPEEVFAGKQTPKLRATLAQLIADGQRHCATAFTLLGSLPPEVKPVFLPLMLVSRDLDRRSRADADPFTPQASSRLRILWTLWRASRSRLFS
jgi:phytoene synthase